MTKNIQAQILGIAAAALLLAASAPVAAQAGHVSRGTGTHTAAVPHASAHPAAAHSPPAHVSARATSSDLADGVVNIETATTEQLQLLPGIGPSKADAIITFRHAHPFQRVEDILRVRGIGRATFRRLRPMITVNGATTMTTDVRTGRAPTSAPADEPAAQDD